MDREAALAALHQAAMRWYLAEDAGSDSLIEAACNAIIAGVESEAVVDVASASPKDPRSDLEAAISRLAEDLELPWPPPRGLQPFLALPPTLDPQSDSA